MRFNRINVAYFSSFVPYAGVFVTQASTAAQDHVSRLTYCNYLVFQKTGENGWEGTRKDNLPHDGNLKETKTHTKVRLCTPSKGCKVTHHNQYPTVTCDYFKTSDNSISLHTVFAEKYSMTHYLREQWYNPGYPLVQIHYKNEIILEGENQLYL